MKYAYSYLRWSTKLQGEDLKDSKSRQLKSSANWIQEHGKGKYILSDETFIDAGKSGFKGEHLASDEFGKAKGELEKFIRLVEAGTIPKGSLLLIDSYDRFSRLKPSKALALFLRVIEAGIGLVFTGSYRKQIISSETIDNDPDILSFVIGETIRSYNESAEKSRKIISAKKAKLQQLKSGLIVPHNNVPKYLTYNPQSQTYEHNANTPLVAKMAKAFLAGDSLFSLAKAFNLDGIKTFRRGFKWSAGSIRCILKNTVLIGEYLGNKKFNKPIIARDDFDKIQVRLTDNRYKIRGRNAKRLANIFRGLAFCSECKKTMEVCYSNDRNGVPTYRYLRCPSSSHSTACTNRHYVEAPEVEMEFFVEFLMKNPEGIITDNDGQAKAIKRDITVKQLEKAEIEKKLERLATVDSLGIDAFTKQATKLKSELDKVQQEIDFLNVDLRQVQGTPADYTELRKIVLADITSKSKSFQPYDEAVRGVQTALADNDTRKKLQMLLPTLFGKLIIYTEPGGNGNGAFEVLDRQGKIIYTSLDKEN